MIDLSIKIGLKVFFRKNHDGIEKESIADYLCGLFKSDGKSV